jgi:hypothetical protein
MPGRQQWREDAVQQLLDADVLFLTGCDDSQVAFYDQFDHIILLTAPADVILERVAIRTTNGYGKAPEEIRRVLDDLATVEPLLRQAAHHEVSSKVPVDEVATTVLRLVIE